MSDTKIWTWQGALQDHVRFVVNLPFFFIGAVALPPRAVESIHLSVNSINKCPFCTGLHCEIGRMAGLEDAHAVNECAKLSDSETGEFGLYSKYGTTFGKYNGRGEQVEALFDTIATEKGLLAARSARGLAFFLTWGSMGGNTLISFYRGTLKCDMREGSNIIFEVIFALYYSVLFAIITFVSKLLSFFPSNVAPVVNIVIGLVLPLVASVWIIPYGIVGLLLSPCLMFKTWEPLGGEYLLIV